MHNRHEYGTPILCFGTFFTLLLREGVDNLSSKGFESAWQSNPQNYLSQVTAFLCLNRVVDPDFTPNNEGTFKGQATDFKACKQDKAMKLPIVSASERASFLDVFESEYERIYAAMDGFVQTYIHPSKDKRIRLVKSIIEVIDDDKSIDANDTFYIYKDQPLKKSQFIGMRSFSFTSFVLAVFRFIIEFRLNANKQGRATYELWCSSDGKYNSISFTEAAPVGSRITEPIDLLESPLASISSGDYKHNIDNLSGIDLADKLKREAMTQISSGDFDETTLAHLYDAWLIYQLETGEKSSDTRDVFSIMRDIFSQIHEGETFNRWLQNVGESRKQNA